MEHEAAAQIQLEFQARSRARGEHPQVEKGRLRYWRLCLRRSARRGGETPRRRSVYFMVGADFQVELVQYLSTDPALRNAYAA